MVAQIDKNYISYRPSRVWSRLVSYVAFEGRPITTRGRWINVFLFQNFKLIRLIPQAKKIAPPVFIVGTGRSGTTILGVVMSMHKDIGFLNEPKVIWASLNKNDDLIGSYSEGDARYRLYEKDASSSIVQGAHRIYGAYLKICRSKIVLDKYPEMIFRVPYLKKIFPNSKFLFLSRNGWDTCSSINQWSERLGEEKNGKVHNWWGVDDRKWLLLVEQLIPEHSDLSPHKELLLEMSDHRHRAAVEWIVTMREGVSLLNSFPEAVLHIPFERLASNTEETMDKVSKFLDLRDDQVFEDYARDTLKPTESKPHFALPDFLVDPFLETQRIINEAANGQ